MVVRESSFERCLTCCRSLGGVTEDVKWDNDLVFSVGGKMFAVFLLPEGSRASFKVDPALFGSLTDQKEFEPAPYLAKHGWVQLSPIDSIPQDALEQFLIESHRLVASKLSKKLQRSLGLLE